MSNFSEEPELAIGEVARRTGLTEATIRAWEHRHGFPRPARSNGSHRRYSAADVEALRRVAEERAAGVPLADAIRAATASAGAPAGVFGVVRARFPELAMQPIAKRRLTVLSHAIEDEIASRASGGLLLGCFQKPRFFAAARDRWLDMARGIDLCVVLAAFERPGEEGGICELPLPSETPLHREWVLVWNAHGAAAFLAACERPGQDRLPDRDRLFDLVWGVDPAPARHVAERVAATIAEVDRPMADAARGSLAGIEPPPLRDQLRLGAAISARVLAS